MYGLNGVGRAPQSRGGIGEAGQTEYKSPASGHIASGTVGAPIYMTVTTMAIEG